MPLETLNVLDKYQPVLTSKLNSPKIQNVLTRPRLIEMAQLEQKRMLTICAGPGYGKTILMAQLADLHKGPRVWYQVDDYDKDPAVFLRQLITGISVSCDGIGKRSLLRLKESTSIEEEGESILAVLIDEMEEKLNAPLIICIDDYHLLEKTELSQKFITFLNKHLPNESSVILASRTVPKIPFGRMRTQGLLQEIKEDDLRFSFRELERLLIDTWDLEIDKNGVMQLHEWIEGWAAGLVLIENCLRSGNDVEFLQSQKRIQQNIFEYLAEEVFDNQAEETKSLLMYCALMETIDFELLNDILNIDDMHLQIERIEKNNLFTSQIGETDFYRQHALFRKYLLIRLSKLLSRKEINEIRMLIANRLEARGEGIDAIHQYFYAESSEDVIRLTEKFGSELMRNGEHLTLKHWLNLIGKTKLTPILQVQLGQCLMAFGEINSALRIMKKAKKLLNKKDMKNICNCSLAIAECLSILGRPSDGVKELEPLMTQSLTPKEQAKVLFKICICHWNNFDSQNLHTYLKKVKKIVKEEDSEGLMCQLEDLLGVEALRDGNFKKAKIHFQNVVKSAEGHIGQRFLLITKNNLASSLLMSGDYANAVKQALFCLDNAKLMKENIFIPLFLDTYGCVLMAQGDPNGQSLVHEAVEILDKKNIFEISRLYCHLGTYARRNNDYVRAIIEHKKCIKYAKNNNNKYDTAIGLANLGADLIRSHQHEKGKEKLVEAYDIASENKFYYILTNIDFHTAWEANLACENQKVLQHLSIALKRAGKYQQNHFIIQEGKISLPLFTTAIANDIEAGYVAEILEKIGEPALLALEPLLTSNQVEIRMRAIKIIVRIGGRNAITLIRRALRDKDSHVRAIAKSELSNLRSKRQLPSDILTFREMEVLGVLATGASNRQIAETLFISEPTVKTHINKIFQKLGINRRLEAIIYFQQLRKATD